MLRLAGIVISVGLADSLNPSTIGPALYLATGQRPALRVALFTLGVFAVNFIGGVVLAIGPGRLLLGLVPHPRGTVRHLIELVAGLVLLGVATALWRRRHSLARRRLPMRSGHGRSALFAGASIAAVELPTAVPYFAVIAAIVASSASVGGKVGLIGLFCIAFVLPLLVIIGTLLIAGKRAEPRLERLGALVQRRWPVVLAVILFLAGGVLTVLGASRLL